MYIASFGIADRKEHSIGISGDVAHPAKTALANNTHRVAFPPLPELIEKVIEKSIPVYG